MKHHLSRFAAILALGLVARAASAEEPELNEAREHQEKLALNARLLAERFGTPDLRDLYRRAARVGSLEKVRERERARRSPLAAGGAWSFLGPSYKPRPDSDDSGLVSSIALHPTDPNTIYVSTASSGVWKTTDGGGSWRLATEDVGILQVGAVAVAPSNGNRVYAGTGCGDSSSYLLGPGWQYNEYPLRIGVGVLISNDGGTSWRVSRTSPHSIFWDILVDTQNPDVLLAAGDQGVQRSADGGDTWTPVLRTDTAPFATRLVRPAGDSQVLYAATWGPRLSGSVWKSIDGGMTWSEKSNGLPGDAQSRTRVQVAVAANDPNRVFALVNGPDSGQLDIARSDDGGESWRPLGIDAMQIPILNQGNFAITLSVDPKNADIVYASGLDTWKSTDGGASWARISDWRGDDRPYVHADHHAHAYGSDGSFYDGNDGGIFVSRDGGASFRGLNKGLASILVSKLCTDPQNPDRMMIGAQDNGQNIRVSGEEWRFTFSGDGFGCTFHPTNGQLLLAASQGEAIYRSTDGGTTWGDGTQGLTEARGEQSFFQTKLIRHPAQADTVFTSTRRNIWVTQDNGGSWGLLSQQMPLIDLIVDFTLSSDGSRGAFIEARGTVYETSDSGASWTQRGKVPASQFETLRYDPADPNKMYVSTIDPAAQQERLWMSADSGVNWTAISRTGQANGLPDLPLLSFEPDPRQANVLWAGSFIGLYRSGDGGQSWERFGTGLPNVPVSSIGPTMDGSKLRVGTYGRGVWEIASPAGSAGGGSTSSGTPAGLSLVKPVAAFIFQPDKPEPGRSVQFKDTSTGVIGAWLWSFGDGSPTSNRPDPEHFFTNAGTYSVTLKVTNSVGSDQVSKTVVVAFPTAGADQVYNYIVPVVLTAAGAGGTNFTTELTLANNSPRDLTLTFKTKGTIDATATYVLKPGQKIFSDVFQFLAGLGVAVPPGTVITTLRIDVGNATEPGEFGAQVRVVTPPNDALRAQGIAGRFGLAFPALFIGLNADREAIVYGLQQTSAPGQAGTRSNLACVHAGAGTERPIRLEVTYHDGVSGKDHSAKDTLDLGPFEFKQLGTPLASRGIRFGWATIRKVAGDDQFACYGVLNDNLNGDGSFVPMVPNDVESDTADAIIPVVVATDTFHSELTLANRSPRKITAAIALVPFSNPYPSWGNIDIEAGRELVIPDIVAELKRLGFRVPSGNVVGSLFVEFQEYIPPIGVNNPPDGIPTSQAYAGVRTYATKAGGLFGLAYGYSPLGYAADSEAWVYGLQQTGTRGQDGGTRANLALLHALSGDELELKLEVTYFGPDGRELGKEPKCNPCTLQPAQWIQFNAPLEANGYNVPHAYARIRRISGNDQFLAYGILNDQANDDGSFVPMNVP